MKVRVDSVDRKEVGTVRYYQYKPAGSAGSQTVRTADERGRGRAAERVRCAVRSVGVRVWI
eukprot:3480614-Pleurochrysis_carterae.AAC.1